MGKSGLVLGITLTILTLLLRSDTKIANVLYLHNTQIKTNATLIYLDKDYVTNTWDVQTKEALTTTNHPRSEDTARYESQKHTIDLQYQQDQYSQILANQAMLGRAIAQFIVCIGNGIGVSIIILTIVAGLRFLLIPLFILQSRHKTHIEQRLETKHIYYDRRILLNALTTTFQCVEPPTIYNN